MKYYVHKVYFFKNGKMIVSYKRYFFRLYYAIYDDYLKLDSDFNMNVNCFVDYTFMTDLQTEQFFLTLDKKNYRPLSTGENNET